MIEDRFRGVRLAAVPVRTGHYVFGDEEGHRIVDVKTACENAVLKAPGVKPARTATGGLSAERGKAHGDRPALPRPAPRGRVAQAGSRLAAARRQRVPRTRERDDDGGIPEREGRLPAGADRAEAFGARQRLGDEPRRLMSAAETRCFFRASCVRLFAVSGFVFR